jgi:hypothetical protein
MVGEKTMSLKHDFCGSAVATPGAMVVRCGGCAMAAYHA